MDIVKIFPAIKDNVWGGTKLVDKYGKKTDMRPVAEAWELAFHKDGKCTLEDGRTLESVAGEKELGKNVKDFPFFPTLIKLIDAKSDLSVQVHPSDDYALKNENSFGKTEMWYIVEAEKGAGLYVGFNKDVDKTEYEEGIKNGTLIDMLNFIEVKAGDCFFIPSGTIHAIGKGCLICEIQQNSNLTYRVYDYKRKDKNGKERELHVDKALLVTNLEKFADNSARVKTPNGEIIGISKYFTTEKINLGGKIQAETDGSTFHYYILLKGSAAVGGVEIGELQSAFVPADFGRYEISGRGELIRVSLRRYGVKKTGECFELFDDKGTVIGNSENRKELLCAFSLSDYDLTL